MEYTNPFLSSLGLVRIPDIGFNSTTPAGSPSDVRPVRPLTTTATPFHDALGSSFLINLSNHSQHALLSHPSGDAPKMGATSSTATKGSPLFSARSRSSSPPSPTPKPTIRKRRKCVPSPKETLNSFQVASVDYSRQRNNAAAFSPSPPIPLTSLVPAFSPISLASSENNWKHCLPVVTSTISSSLEPAEPTNMQASTSNAVKSHTRRCREKVSKELDHLLSILPPPPPGIELKHKAQILGYTIRTFRNLLEKRTVLQAHIVLFSPLALTSWVQATIMSAAKTARHTTNSAGDSNGALTMDSCSSGATGDANVSGGTSSERNVVETSKDMGANEVSGKGVPFSAVLEAFIGMYCVHSDWPYGEMWLLDTTSSCASLAACVFNTRDGEVKSQLDGFAGDSRSLANPFLKLEEGELFRAAASCTPEWIDVSSKERGRIMGSAPFERMEIAWKHKVKTMMTMPVSVGGGKSVAVLVFADVARRRFCLSDIDELRNHIGLVAGQYIHHMNTVGENFGLPGGTAPITSDARREGLSL